MKRDPLSIIHHDLAWSTSHLRKATAWRWINGALISL